MRWRGCFPFFAAAATAASVSGESQRRQRWRQYLWTPVALGWPRGRRARQRVGAKLGEALSRHGTAGGGAGEGACPGDGGSAAAFTAPLAAPAGVAAVAAAAGAATTAATAAADAAADDGAVNWPALAVARQTPPGGAPRSNPAVFYVAERVVRSTSWRCAIPVRWRRRQHSNLLMQSKEMRNSRPLSQVGRRGRDTHALATRPHTSDRGTTSTNMQTTTRLEGECPVSGKVAGVEPPLCTTTGRSSPP